MLFNDSLDILDKLTDEQAGILFKRISAYHKGEADIIDNGLIDIVFHPFKNQFQRDLEKYELTCKRRAEAGSKGGKQRVANQAIASKSKQKQANQADKDKDKDKDKDIREREKGRKRFTPPSLLEINNYINEKKFTCNAEDFFNYYSANGWMVGRNKMKSWQHSLAMWNSRQGKYDENKSTGKQELNWNIEW